MDLYAENRATMVRQATGMIVSMVSVVVVSTLKRVRGEPKTEPNLDPNPFLYDLRSDAEPMMQK